MRQPTIPDPSLIQQLFGIAERYKSDPEQKITGAAVEGLRLLFILTAGWLKCLESGLADGQRLAADQLPPGLPATVAEAQALHRRAAEAVLDVLRIRALQREQQRDAGGPIFTSADAEAARLWSRASDFLNPLPLSLLVDVAATRPSGNLPSALREDSHRISNRATRRNNKQRLQKQLRKRPQPATIT